MIDNKELVSCIMKIVHSINNMERDIFTLDANGRPISQAKRKLTTEERWEEFEKELENLYYAI